MWFVCGNHEGLDIEVVGREVARCDWTAILTFDNPGRIDCTMCATWPMTKTAGGHARAIRHARWRACVTLAIGLLRKFKVPNIKAAFRDLAADAGKVLKMLRL